MNARLWALRCTALVLLPASIAALLFIGCKPAIFYRPAARNSPVPDHLSVNGSAVNDRSPTAVSADDQAPEGRQQAWLPFNDGLAPHAVVTSLAFDVKDSGRVFVGTASADGLWISDDGGVFGTPVGGALAGQAVYALLSEPGRIDAATTQGVYESRDAGRTWDREPGLLGLPVYALARDSTGALLAGGEGPVVYRLAPAAGAKGQAEQAAGWRTLSPLPRGAAVLALAVTAGDCLLAGTDGAGLWRSRDGGQSWENVVEVGPTFVAALRVTASDGRTAFARTRRGLLVTTDGGASWRETALALPGRIDAIAPGITDGEALIGTSQGEIYQFEPGGENPARWSAGLGHPGTFGVVAVAPDQSSLWYAGTSNGLFISRDGGKSWQADYLGPGHPMAGTLAEGPDGALYMGNSDGLFRSSAPGERWESWGQGLPADQVEALAFGPAGSGLAYAGLAGQGLYRSDDGGSNWVPTGWTGHGVPGLLVDHADPRHLYIRAAYERVYESRDAGDHWVARWDGLGLSTQVISLAQDPWQTSVFFAGSDEGLVVSSGSGSAWRSAGSGLAGQTVFAIAFDPAERARVYAAATDGPYRSLDGGRSWARWGQGLEDVTVTAFTFAPQTGAVYAGTKYRGVFVSRDGGQHWLEAGLPAAGVSDLLLSADSRWLLAATSQGVFGRKLEAP